MKRFSTLSSAIFVFSVLLPAGCQSPVKWQYPEARREHSRRQLLTPTKWPIHIAGWKMPIQRNSGWVEKQNELTERFLAASPQREKISQAPDRAMEISALFRPGKNRHAHTSSARTTASRTSPSLYMQTTLDSEPQVAINPNLLSDDGTIAVTGSTGKQGRNAARLRPVVSWQRLAEDKNKEYRRRRGFPRNPPALSLRVRRVAARQSGFYYNRFPDPNTSPQEDRYNYSSV